MQEDSSISMSESFGSAQQHAPSSSCNTQPIAVRENEQRRDIVRDEETQRVCQCALKRIDQVASHLVSDDCSSKPVTGAFFEGCADIEINNSTVKQVFGDYTNVTINIPQSSEDKWNAIQNHTVYVVKSSGSLPPQIPGTSTNVTVSEPTPIVPNSTIEQSPQDNYEKYLTLKGRGFPLWNPSPMECLPLSYRRSGVAIGDVGLITASGAFLFLFNICLPSDHLINPSRFPDGFIPLSIEPTEKSEIVVFESKSHLASPLIGKVDGSQSQTLSFEASTPEGVILALPEGAIALDFQNISRFRTYAGKNVENWYRYANGTLGLGIRNGDIRLVTGCDRTTSWGIAILANPTQHKEKYSLKCLPTDSTSDGEVMSSPSDSSPRYMWEYSGLGMTSLRVGPQLREIEELEQNHDDSTVLRDGRHSNQCLFLRTLNIMLSDKAFSEITDELAQQMVIDAEYDENVTVSESAPASVSCTLTHPADTLNSVLLKRISSSRVAITHDQDWCAVIDTNDSIMPSPNNICERVLTIHDISSEDDIVFLARNEGLKSTGIEDKNQSEDINACPVSTTESPSLESIVQSPSRGYHAQLFFQHNLFISAPAEPIYGSQLLTADLSSDRQPHSKSPTSSSSKSYALDLPLSSMSESMDHPVRSRKLSVFPEPRSMNRPVRPRMLRDFFFCHLCNARYTRRHNLRNHIDTHNCTDVHCEKCGKSMPSTSLRRHAKKCGGAMSDSRKDLKYAPILARI
ncbi:hypothetical protein BDN70DRAFT_993606 [Pholiota conissans]|uniref:C2H2-type domain-containing protein n=1 Tax=Pholiota conissans TaxID=109636 RepID=A0A9P5Z342_9AGAR|nr:hypothetical protein BDN70DRAFT_993606 [Pholiota conissans]